MSELTSLSDALEGLDQEAKDTVMLAVQEEIATNYKMPPMSQVTVSGLETFGYATSFPSALKPGEVRFDYDLVDKMMATGQIAYPMALKKAPITSIVRSPSGFSVACSDERMKDLILANMQRILEKRIDEILTMLEYGAYYAEVTYGIGWPQDFGLKKSTLPYWLIKDFNACHPTTIEEIIRDKKTRAFRGFIQAPITEIPTERVKVGTDRALIIPHNGLFGKLEGVSILKPVHIWWFWYELVWRAFLRYLQRQGLGVVVVKAPSRGRVEVSGKFVDNMQWALQLASSLHRTNFAAVPSDADPDSGQPLWVVDFLKMDADGGRQFISALELLANNIKNFLLTGEAEAGDNGEYEVMLDAEKTLSHIAMYINNYVLPKFLMWNGSSTRIATLDFQGANSRVLPLIFKLLAVAGNTTGDALQNVDWRLLMAEGGVPVLTEEEVEELREKKMEDFERMRQPAAGSNGEDEKAKMPSGGEGTWASKRDKEGEPETLEMIRAALGTPIVALTAPQVLTLEEMGIRADAGPIVLYNPWHDKAGRFSDKAHATTPMKEGLVSKHGPVTNRSMFIASDAAAVGFEKAGTDQKPVHVHGNRASFIKSMCGTDVKCARAAPRTVAAYTDGAIHVNPKALKLMKKDRRLAEYVMTHEALHSKPRDGGREVDVSFGGDSGNTVHRALAHHQIEEGTTDLLARRLNDIGYKDNFGLKNPPFYMPQMGAIAILVGILSEWNQAEAWRLVEQMHYNINNDEYIFGLLEEAFGGFPGEGWDDDSLYAVLITLQEYAEEGDYQELAWLFSSRGGAQ